MKLKSLLVATLTMASLHGQEKPADPYRETKGFSAKTETVPPKNISICYETFSLPLAMAAKLAREQPADSDLYTRITAAVEKQNARQETFTMLRARSGQKSNSESHSEQIFPVGYEPAELPGSVGVAISPSKAADTAAPIPDATKLVDAPELAALHGLMTPATPTAFQMRSTGVTVEVEPVLGLNDDVVDLRILPGHVTLVGRSAWGQGLSTTESPVFENQSLNTSATLRLNQPFLLGTLNRTPNSKIDPDSANRVWFAFVTVALAKP